MSEKTRIIAFVDGYNLYHAIKKLNQNHLKWLNLKTLIEQYIHSPTEKIVDVFYFTALAEWKNRRGKTGTSPVERHKDYILALESVGIKTVYGKFKKKNKSCPSCKKLYPTHEEKETDVNIAMYLTALAYEDSFDTAIIVSADSDLIPPIKLIQSKFKNKKIHILVPPNYYDITIEIRSFCKTSKIKKKILNRCLLENKIEYQGNTIIKDIKYNE